MRDEIPEADAYLLQHRTVEEKDTGEWHDQKVVTSRQGAETWLRTTPNESACRAVPLVPFEDGAAVEEGLGYTYESRAEWEAAAL